MKINRLFLLTSLIVLTSCSLNVNIDSLLNVNSIFGVTSSVPSVEENLVLSIAKDKIYYGEWTTFEVLNSNGPLL